jgi:hypothetical protein
LVAIIPARYPGYAAHIEVSPEANVGGRITAPTTLLKETGKPAKSPPPLDTTTEGAKLLFKSKPRY